MRFFSKRPGSFARCACLLFLLIGLIYGQSHVTRIEIKSGSNTATRDIVHNLPEFDFKGETPVLKVVSGQNQPKGTGFLPLPIIIAVYHADGTTLWPFAPVTLGVEYGRGGWAAASGGAVSSTLTVAADASGQARVYYWMP